MRILYLIHQFYPEHRSGTEKFLLNLASSVQRDGHYVQVLTYTHDCKESRKEENLFVKEYRHGGLPVTALRHRQIPPDINTGLANPDILRFAGKFLRANRFDILHCAHGMRVGSFAVAAEEFNLPTVYTITDFWTLCPKINLQTSSGVLCGGPKAGAECSRLCPELEQKFIETRLAEVKGMLTRAKAIAVPSRFVRSILQSELGDLRVRLIPHGIPRPQISPPAKNYGTNSKLTFGYASGLAPHKGVHILVAAFRRLNAPAELKIYGEDTNQAEYINLLQDVAGGDPRIQFCGAYTDEQVDSVFAEIDVLVVPSLCYETYSFSTHEALTRGVPVIASRLGSLPDTVQDGTYGLCVRVGDIEDLTSKIQQVADHPERLNDFRVNLDTRVSPMVEEEAYMYQRLYTEITGNLDPDEQRTRQPGRYNKLSHVRPS